MDRNMKRLVSFAAFFVAASLCRGDELKSRPVTFGSGSSLTINSGVTVTGNSGSVWDLSASTLNLPDLPTLPGSILATNISAPSTPASGKTKIYVDSTSKNIAAKNDAGTVNHGIQNRTAFGNLFINQINSDGTTGIAQAITSVGTTSPITGGTITNTGTIGLDVSVDHAFTSPQSITEDDAKTNSVDTLLTLSRSTSGTAAAGLGSEILFPIERASGALEDMGSIQVIETNTTLLFSSKMLFMTADSGGLATEWEISPAKLLAHTAIDAPVYQLSGSPLAMDTLWDAIKTTAADRTTTSTTLGAVTDWTTSTLTSVGLYEFEIVMRTSCSGTGGSQFAIHGNGSGTAATAQATGTWLGGISGGVITITNIDTASTTVNTNGASTLNACFFKGFFTANSTGTLTVTVQFKSVTSGQTTTVKAGSAFKYRKAL